MRENHTLEPIFTRTRSVLSAFHTLRRITQRLDKSTTLGKLFERIRRAWLSSPRCILAGPAKGLILDARFGGYVGQFFGVTGDDAELECMQSLLRGGTVYYDIGAHIGFYALIAVCRVGAAGRIVAFEPHPTTFAALENNIRLNKLANVLPINVAVSNAKGTAKMKKDAETSLTSTVVANDEVTTTEGSISVDTDTLDSLVASLKLPFPHVVTIDVEGHEISVLEGMVKTIDAHRPTMIIEVHGTGPELGAWYKSNLAPLGYLLTDVSGRTVPSERCRYHALLVSPRLSQAPAHGAKSVPVRGADPTPCPEHRHA